VSRAREVLRFLVAGGINTAITYLLYLLRDVRFAGTPTENPYLASVALTDAFLDQRLRVLRGLTYRRMGQLVEFEWEAPTLSGWAEAHL